MATPASWRQFQLFDFTPIRDPNSSADEPALWSDASVSAITATSEYLIVADHNAYLKVASTTDFTLQAQFIAYDLTYRITYVYPVPNLTMVVTLAEYQGQPAVIKLWDLTKIVGDKGEQDLRYQYHSQVSVTNGSNSYPVVSFDFTPDLACFAVGYANGKVVLVRGDILRDRGSKQRVVYESNNPITSVHFHHDWESQILFVTTTLQVVTVFTAGRNHAKPQKVLLGLGVDVHCSDITPELNQLVTGTPTHINFYDPQAKIKAIKYEIAKSRVVSVGENYLLVATTEETGDRHKQLVSRVIILDLKHNHVAFNLLIPRAMIRDVFVTGLIVYLLCNDGVLYKIEEKPINQKVELIMQRQLFQVAYSLAEDANLGEAFLLKIQRLHVQFLYDEQKYTEAIQVAISTLDLFVKPTTIEDEFDDFVMSIIIKYNETGNIASLTEFLLALWKKGLATNDHVTLLLCCYCKLKQLDELNEFITTINIDDPKLQLLDFPLLINLFKECGYYELAIKLLQKLNQPNLIVEIQLKDLHQPKAALRLIKQLPVDDLLLIMIDYSKTLLDYHPIETTQLLIEVFTGQYSPDTEVEDHAVLAALAPEETKNEGVVLTSYQAFVTYLLGRSEPDEEPTEVSKAPTYLPPRPHLIFPSFLNHPHEFVIFLEACLSSYDKYQGNVSDKKEILTTLLEMYLKLAHGENGDEWKNKPTELVKAHGGFFDDLQLLLISHIYDFDYGEIAAKEQLGYQLSLFALYQANGDVAKCMKIVREVGSTKPEFYPLMLKMLVLLKAAFDQAKPADFRWILDEIKKHKLMTPLEILQTLTLGGQEYVTLGLVKDYMIDYIEQQQREITNNTKLIEHYEQELSANSLKLTELTSKPFVLQNTKCSECDMRLDFPVVHFKCKHLYHHKCLSNNLVATTQIANGSARLSSALHCPKCFGHVDDDRDFTLTDEVEMFDLLLANSNDKFKVITEYLGKGVMESSLMWIESQGV